MSTPQNVYVCVRACVCACVRAAVYPALSLSANSLGLDLLFHAVLHSQSQLAKLVPLLSQADGCVLCVTVVQYEVLLQQGPQLLNLPQSLFPVRYLTCLGLHQSDSEALDIETIYIQYIQCVCACVCVCVCMHACVRACVCVCVCAYLNGLQLALKSP